MKMKPIPLPNLTTNFMDDVRKIVRRLNFLSKKVADLDKSVKLIMDMHTRDEEL